MKKLFVSIAATLLLVAFAPIQSNAASEKNPTSVSSTDNESAEVKALINRVNEINAMDRSAMSSSEKKVLRKELRSLKRDVNHSHGHGGTVYVSGGVILLIILLIILL